MRVTGNNKLKPFERLVRSHLKADAPFNCSGFDPDLATSYLECALPERARQQYENHLLECYDCRKIVASLSLALEETPDVSDQARVSRTPVHITLFSLLATPKWALSAAALLIALVSIPVIINLNDRKPAVRLTDEVSPETAAQRQGAAPAVEANAAPTPANSPAAVAKRAQNAPTAVTNSIATSVNGTLADGAISAGPAGTRSAGDDLRPAQARDAAREVDRLAEAKNEEVASAKKAEPQPTQPESARGDRTQSASNLRTSESRSDLPKVDTDRAMRLPDEKSKSGEVTTLRRGNVGDSSTEKESTATVKPLDPVTPTPSEAHGAEGAGRAGIAAPPPTDRQKDNKKLAASSDSRLARASEASVAKTAKPEERRVANKTFRLIGGIWTDKSYKADKEIPVVPLTWDTEIYKEILTKQAGLKPYFSGFQSGERVIVVYKGTIYKLSPPEK